MVSRKEFIAKTARQVAVAMVSANDTRSTLDIVSCSTYLAKSLAKELERQHVAPWPESQSPTDDQFNE